MKFNWFDGSKIEVTLGSNEVLVKANAEGLKSLVNCLAALSESNVKGAHFHLDEFTGSEPGSIEIIFEKTKG